jgi:23S rRNA (uridine2552-2'-O)-methyltransferase
MAYDRKDKFYRRAKESGYRSRSAFKIIEINKKFRILKPGLVVLDLGCAPGGWTQVIAKEIGQYGRIIGIDLEPVVPLTEKHAVFIQGDLRQESTCQQLFAALGRKVDLIASDMSPHLSGIKFQDHYNSYELAEQAFKMCRTILREGGNFVVKIFPGEELEQFKKNLKGSFAEIKTFIPEFTRNTSTEIYLVAKTFKNGGQPA